MIEQNLELAPEITGEKPMKLAQTADEPKPAEIVQLETAVKNSGVELATAEGLIQSFAPIFREVHDLLEKAKAAPKVSDATQLTEMRKCHDLRMALVKQRTTGDKLRERLKADSLMRGKAIQGVYNLLEFMVKPIEAHLEEQEKFAERAEAARLEARRQARTVELLPFVTDTGLYNLGVMSDEQYAIVLADAKAAHQARLDREAKEKAEAEAKAKAEAERIEAQRIENVRLQMGIMREKQISVFTLAASVTRPDDLGAMTKDDFTALMDEMRGAHNAEADRLNAIAEAKEAALKAEREEAAAKLKAEQDKARAEREAAEAIAKAERDKAAAALKKQQDEAAAKAREAKAKADAEAKKIREEAAERERIANEKAQAEAAKLRKEREEAAAAAAKVAAELAAKKAAEEKAIADKLAEEKVAAEEKLAAEKAAAAAPDREKLLKFASVVRELPVPTLGVFNNEISLKLQAQVEKFAAWIEAQAESI